jgi:uncharacterized protein
MKKCLMLFSLFFIVFRIYGQTICLCDLTAKDSILYYNDKIFTGKVNELYKNGKIKNEGFVKDGKLDSTFTLYNKKGKIIEVVRFKENRQINRTQYINTFLTKKIVTLKDNIEDGLYVDYYPNGLIKDSGYYSMGKAVGKWTYWNNKGKIFLEINVHDDYVENKFYMYKNDSILFRYEYYDKNGNKIDKVKK